MKNLIIIPAYNEDEALTRTVASLQRLPSDYEVVTVNDGSQDKTGAGAAQLAQTSAVPLHVVNLPLNRGIGVAMQTGYLFARQRGTYKEL